MPEIKVVELSKQWGKTPVVDRVSFTVAPKSLTVLLGPSGCGKSTTLRLIAGLDTATSGTITIDGEDVTRLPPVRRSVAMVFQSYALFPHLSVAENIVFGLRVRRVSAAERARRLDWAGQLLGLGGLFERKPGQLSGGQQQRVALGRAIVSRASICLMDEPLSNLDAKLRHEMRKEIRTLQQELGITMIYVTHDQIEAMTLADQVILLSGGRVEQAARPDELYARPATAFAASFIGTPPMNLLALDDGPGGAVIDGTTGRALIAGPGRGRLLGIRPEHVRTSRETGLIDAKVVSAEYHGADTVVTFRVGTQQLVARIAGAVSITPGEVRRVSWEPEVMHLFEAGSGRQADARRLLTHEAA